MDFLINQIKNVIYMPFLQQSANGCINCDGKQTLSSTDGANEINLNQNKIYGFIFEIKSKY